MTATMLKKEDFVFGGIGYVTSSIIVYTAIACGCAYFPHPVEELNTNRSVMSTLFFWDGGHYRRIAIEGYSYAPNLPSNVAFFPLYPYLAKAIANLAGINTSFSLLLLSNFFLAGSYTLIHAYARLRFPDQPKMPIASLMAFALYPPTTFFHLPYSESLFIFLILLALLAIHYNCSIGMVAFIIGAATAVRAVGLCLLPLLIQASYHRGGTRLHILLRGCFYVPVATYGLSCFILLQYMLFSEPFGFVYAHHYWCTQPPTDWPDKLYSLLVLEPFWGAVNRSSPFFWWRTDNWLPAYLSLSLFNRIAFAFSVILLYIDCLSNRLSRSEWLSCLLLIMVPYFARSYDTSMTSMARYTAVALPLYFVAGRLLLHIPRSLAIAIVFLSFLLLITFASLFGAGFAIY